MQILSTSLVNIAVCLNILWNIFYQKNGAKKLAPFPFIKLAVRT